MRNDNGKERSACPERARQERRFHYGGENQRITERPKKTASNLSERSGGGFMSVSMDKTATLRAQMGGHPPIVYTLKIRGGAKEEAREH